MEQRVLKEAAGRYSESSAKEIDHGKCSFGTQRLEDSTE